MTEQQNPCLHASRKRGRGSNNPIDELESGKSLATIVSKEENDNEYDCIVVKDMPEFKAGIICLFRASLTLHKQQIKDMVESKGNYR